MFSPPVLPICLKFAVNRLQLIGTYPLQGKIALVTSNLVVDGLSRSFSMTNVQRFKVEMLAVTYEFFSNFKWNVNLPSKLLYNKWVLQFEIKLMDIISL